MKKILILGFGFGLMINFNAQTLVFNDKLFSQLTKNQAVRLASNESFFNSYEKQKKTYDEINQKITQVVAIQELIYKNLKNVNSAIKQSKKLYYLYQYIGKIYKNAQEMLELTTQHPEYAILITKYYTEIGEQAFKLEQEISTALLNENNDFLMDSNDREMLLENIFLRARHINGNIIYINMRLKYCKRIPYLFQVPVLKNYLVKDKLIVSDIMNKYKNIVL